MQSVGANSVPSTTFEDGAIATDNKTVSNIIPACDRVDAVM